MFEYVFGEGYFYRPTCRFHQKKKSCCPSRKDLLEICISLTCILLPDVDIDSFFETDAIWMSPQKKPSLKEELFLPLLDLSWFHNPDSSLTSNATNHMATGLSNPNRHLLLRGQPIRGHVQWKGPLWYGVSIQLPSQGPSNIGVVQGGRLAVNFRLGWDPRWKKQWSSQGMWQSYTILWFF